MHHFESPFWGTFSLVETMLTPLAARRKSQGPLFNKRSAAQNIWPFLSRVQLVAMHPLKNGINYEESARAQRRTLRTMQQKVHQFSRNLAHRLLQLCAVHQIVPKSTNCNPEEAVRDMKMVHSRFGDTIDLI